MKNSYIILLILLFISIGCEELTVPEPTSKYTNLDDNTTTSINTNIPRLKLDLSEGKVVASISVTNQNGEPLENFQIGNYLIREVITIPDTTHISAVLVNSEENKLPLGLSAVVDYSGSLTSIDIENSEQALLQFLSVKDPLDQFSIIKFSSFVSIVQNFTSDTNILTAAINSPYNSGGTALYEACQVALSNSVNQNIGDSSFPIIVAFTDGIDNNSNISVTSLISNSIETGIPIYSIGIGDGVDQILLSNLSNSTGGRFLFTPSSDELGELYLQISNQLSTLYTATWDYSGQSGKNVTVIIDVEYTAGSGTFTSRAIGFYTIP